MSYTDRADKGVGLADADIVLEVFQLAQLLELLLVNLSGFWTLLTVADFCGPLDHLLYEVAIDVIIAIAYP